MRALTLILSAGLLFIAACDESNTSTTAAPEPAPPPAAKMLASCDAIEGMSVCVDFPTKDVADKECGSFEGKVKEATCTKKALVGSCQLKDAIRHYYSAGEMPNDAAYAKGHCKNAMGGKFMAASL